MARNLDAAALSQAVKPWAWSLLQEAIGSRRSVVSGAGVASSAASENVSTIRPDAQTILCVPVLPRDRVLGVIYAARRAGEANAATSDREILESLANHASVAIENARLTERMLLMERLSAVGRMVSFILHDFRAPCAASVPPACFCRKPRSCRRTVC